MTPGASEIVAEAPAASPEEMMVALESEDSKQVTALVASLASLKVDDRKKAAAETASFVKTAGITALQTNDLLGKIRAAKEDAKEPLSREGALLAVAELVSVVGKPVEPYVVPMLSSILNLQGDKVNGVRQAADQAASAISSILSPNSVKVLLPILFEALESSKWQTKAGALNIMIALARSAPLQMSWCLPEIVPAVSNVMADTKQQVVTAAFTAMTELCSVEDNKDIEPFVPALISCLARPHETPECVRKLAGTTFVQSVKAPTLAIMVPLLIRGLRERQTAVKRQTAVIIDNMAKLVDDPTDATVFLPKLLPDMERAKNEISDPEARTVAARAHATLVRVQEEAKAKEVAEIKKVDKKAMLAAFKENLSGNWKDDFALTTLEYVSELCCYLVAIKDFQTSEWVKTIVPYLAAFMDKDAAENAAKAVLDWCIEDTSANAAEDDDEEGEDLCKCDFSLAYGAKILLNNAKLHLKRGKRYGLCGPNGAGKSTLMRAIANGQLEGFPPKEELRTIYVEHDIDATQSEMAVIEFVVTSPELADIHPDLSVCESILTSVGFTEEMQKAPVASLSGGWRMKLALARAMLYKADIMLLDEPTNHLDVKNVAWLENYLTNLPTVTSMIVSHDSGFLDTVCTHIIHYEGRKLRTYRGNLSELVKVRPEAASYYKLADTTIKFSLPEPGFLEGIKSKDRAILKMHQVGFTYPNTTRKVLEGVSIFCTLNSRVVVMGANGAGKSTMIKILTGEMEPQEGVVWKHPNLRIAYVAQHAFHHIEKHLDKTANEYIQWRYATGEDRESQEKVTRILTEEEQKKMASQFMHDGIKKVVDKIVSRRKLKKGYEYEVSWKGMGPDKNSWLTRDFLEEMGFSKLVNDVDMKEAARMGMVAKPLTQANIEKHLMDVGLEREISTHTHIGGLSGGQKVKVVLGAAMWNNPHMLVLDEPTNYLDRDSLGALAGAIKEFGGGVIMITHNREFAGELCPESWLVADGKLTAKGVPNIVGGGDKLEWKPQEEVLDALGNTIKVKAPKKELSRQEKKKREKIRKAKLERGEAVSDDEEDW
eukprot:jgi/Chlat1/4508/Chrsp29S04441